MDTSTTSTQVKFSFAKSTAKPVINKRPQEEERKDYIKEISGNEILSFEPQQTKSGPLVIPLDGQGHTKKKKLNAHVENPATPPPPPPSISLLEDSTVPKSLDQIAVEELVKDARNEGDTEIGARSVPLTVQNQIEGIDAITDDDERFKYDLDSRPDEADEEAYEEMPIEEFGFAMLRGMGWAPGKQIGLNSRGLAEPIEFVKRPGYRLGLGATPKDLPVKKKKYIKPGESRDAPPVMVAATGPDGKVRHVKSISEKLVPFKKGLQSGQLVIIVSGPHEGLYARILTANIYDDEVDVRLEASGEDVQVTKSDVQVVDLASLADGHPALKYMKKKEEERERERERERDERDEKDSDAYQKKDSKHKQDSSSSKHSDSSSKKSSKSSSSKSDSSSSKTWIRPLIMVRVVSKSFQNGKFYNKKVRIYDVVGHNECTIQLDNGSLVEGVKQRMLETVIPQAGGKVMIVEGVNKGKVGKLLERMKKGDSERAIVQMIGDLSIETFSLDDVAQYVGSYDDEAVDMTV